MLNIDELEKRWFIYKLKSMLPYIVIFISLVIILLIITAFVQEQQSTELKVQEKIPTIETVELNTTLATDIQQNTIKTKELPKKIQQDYYSEVPSKVKLSPSLDFMKKIQNSNQHYYANPPSNYSSTVNEKTIEVESVQEEENVQLDTVVEELPEVNRRKTVSIKRKNTQNDIFEIITRFKKTNNPALSLFVAKKYYELKNYTQAYNYALITNDINENIEASWIIFAKSLVKLNHKNKAIETLNKYIAYSHSSSAKILLDEIKSGKFK